MLYNSLAADIWKAMSSIRASLGRTSQPGVRSALVVAEASMLILLQELARHQTIPSPALPSHAIGISNASGCQALT